MTIGEGISKLGQFGVWADVAEVEARDTLIVVAKHRRVSL